MKEKTIVSEKQLNKLLRINSSYFNYLKTQQRQSSYEKQKIVTVKQTEPYSEYGIEFKKKKYCKSKKIDPPQDYRENTKMFQLQTTKQLDYQDKTFHHLKRPQTACLPQKKTIKETFFQDSTYVKHHDPKPHIDEPYQLKLDYPQTIMEGLSLNASSEYQRQFRSFTPEPDIIFGGKSMFGNPMSPNVAMFRDSETHRFFRPMKIKQHKIVPPSLAKKLALDTSLTIPNIPPFQGQYDTVNKREFSEKKISQTTRRFV